MRFTFFTILDPYLESIMIDVFENLSAALAGLHENSTALGASLTAGNAMDPVLLAPVLASQAALAEALDEATLFLAETESFDDEKALALYRKATSAFAGVYLAYKMRQAESLGTTQPFGYLFSEIRSIQG